MSACSRAPSSVRLRTKAESPRSRSAISTSVRTTRSSDLPKDLDPGVLRKLSHTEIQGRPIDIRPDSGRPGRPFKKRNFDKQPGDGRNFKGDRRGGKKFGGRGDRPRDRY